MQWHEDIIAGLPQPDDREPRSLRGDIADELADHLACAMHHELKRTDDEAVARRKVLERFGDIKKIARQLWWDAMRDRIMKDRLFLIGTFLVMIALVAAFVLPWAAKQNQINEAILAKLEQLNAPPPPAATQPAVAENWSRLTVRVVRGERNDVPVMEASIELKGRPFTSDTNPRSLYEHTDSHGEVTYGPILPGFYQLRVHDPLLGVFCNTQATLYPGAVVEKTIRAPDLPAQAKLKFEVEPSDELKSLDAAIHLRIEPQPLHFDSQRWEAYLRELTLDWRGNIIALNRAFSSFKRQVGGKVIEVKNALRVDNPLKPAAEIDVSPWPYQITAARVATPFLSDSPASSAWKYSEPTVFIIPDQPRQIDTSAGETTLVTLTVPPAVIKAANELKSPPICNLCVADAQWRELAHKWKAASEKAIELARQHGDAPAAQQAYEEAVRAEEQLSKRVGELTARRPCSGRLDSNAEYIRMNRESATLGQPLIEAYRRGEDDTPQFKEMAAQYTRLDQQIRRLCLMQAIADEKHYIQRDIQRSGPEHPKVADRRRTLEALEQELAAIPEPPSSVSTHPAE